MNKEDFELIDTARQVSFSSDKKTYVIFDTRLVNIYKYNGKLLAIYDGNGKIAQFITECEMGKHKKKYKQEMINDFLCYVYREGNKEVNREIYLVSNAGDNKKLMEL